jgi:hypothetical protein
MATSKVKTATLPRRTPTTTTLRDSAAVAERTEGDKITLVDTEVDEGEKVTVIIPKAFTLTRDSGAPVTYEAGVQEMLVDDAGHWYARAMGVKVYEASE